MKERVDVRQRLTIANIAAAANVSMPTVSRVLNQRPDVSPETRERVLRVIAEHGYVSNRSTHPTKETATKLIDLIISGPLDSEYYLELIRGIDESLNRTGRRLALFTMHNEKRLEEDWLAHLSQRCPEGVLLLAHSDHFLFMEALHKLHIPYVVVDDSRELGPDVPLVGATNWRGGLTATEYLLSLGHRRIANISGIPSHLTSKARVAGYRSALEAAGMTPDPALIRQGDFGHTSGYDQTLALLALAEPPTAIVAGCDIQATGIYRALFEHGMQVPHDLSIIGFDDIPSTEWMSPPLTTIRQPLREMGSIAVDLLLQQITGEQLKSLRVELATSLVVRQSCAPPS
jgi:DNA-binding LacI/PurR family transcriptional regulator